MINIEVNKEGKSVSEFLKVDNERIMEISDSYQQKPILEILEDILINTGYTMAERVAMLVQLGFNFGQNVLMQETRQQVEELTSQQLAEQHGLKVH